MQLVAYITPFRSNASRIKVLAALGYDMKRGCVPNPVSIGSPQRTIADPVTRRRSPVRLAA